MVTLNAAAADEGQHGLLWVVGGLGVWVAVAFLVAVVIGTAIRVADRHAGVADDASRLTTADLPATMRAPVGVALPTSAVALDTATYSD
jgi:hypothetical protein